MVPRLVEFFIGKQIIGISGGYYHSACVISTGEVYCFGFSEEGQCGHGGSEMCLVPTLVPIPKQDPIATVSCGGFHTLAVSVTKKPYLWGGGGADCCRSHRR